MRIDAPVHGLAIILAYTFAIGVAESEVELRTCQPLVSSQLQQPHRLLIIAHNTRTVQVAQREVLLCGGIPTATRTPLLLDIELTELRA